MASVVWLRDPFTGKTKPLTVSCGSAVRNLLAPWDKGFPPDDLYVKCNGRLVGADEELQDGLLYTLEPRLRGGKGGFGSMLRALGAQIEKTTNREACRDLSGRRLRDVNHENAMADWVKQQAEREAEKEQRRLERLQRKLAEPKHYFTNLDYQQQCSEMSERLEDSVLKGMQASSSSIVLPEVSDGHKRPNVSEIRTNSGKKKCFWTGVEGVEDSSSSSEDGSDSEDSASVSGTSEESKLRLAERFEGNIPGGSSSKENDLSSAAVEKTQDHIGDFGEDFPRDLTEREAQSTDKQTEKKEAAKDASITAQRVEDAAEDSFRSQETKECHSPPESTLKPQEHIAKDSPNQMMAGEGSSTNVQTGNEGSHRDGITRLVEERAQEKTLVPEVRIILSESVALPPVDLMAFASAAALECLGLEALKQELMTRGLKCGGTLQERAARLFSIKGLTRDQIDPALFAKPSKGKKK